MTDEQRKVILKAQQGELDAVLMYQKLAKTAKDSKIQETLMQLAADEGRHAAVFHKMSGTKLKPKSAQANFILCLRYVLGWKTVFKLMSDGEYRAVRTYAPVVKEFPEVESVQSDEQRHGDILKNLL